MYDITPYPLRSSPASFGTSFVSFILGCDDPSILMIPTIPYSTTNSPHHLRYAVDQALAHTRPRLGITFEINTGLLVFYIVSQEKSLSGGESNPALPRDRRVY